MLARRCVGGGSQAVTVITSIVRKGPTRVATRMTVPGPCRASESNSIDSTSAIHCP